MWALSSICIHIRLLPADTRPVSPRDTDVIILSQVHGTLSGFGSRRDKRPRNRAEEGRGKRGGDQDSLFFGLELWLRTPPLWRAANHLSIPFPSLLFLSFSLLPSLVLSSKPYCGKGDKRRDWCCGLVARSCLTLSVTPWTGACQLLCPWDFPGKNTGVGCHFLLQGIFPTKGSNSSLVSPVLAARFFTAVPPGKPHLLQVNM